MRSDFRYQDDPDNCASIIWPEFEDAQGHALAESSQIPLEGTATMWILWDDPQIRQRHRERLHVGCKGQFVAGPVRIADVEVIELLGISERRDA